MSGRHRRQTNRGGGFGAAAIATSGAFAVVPMMIGAGTANAATPNVAPTSDNAPSDGNTADNNASVAGPSTYTVQAGDTLSSIAAGRGANWKAVWTANKTSVPDANVLHPGEKLQLPTGDMHGASTAPASSFAPSNTVTPATLNRHSMPMVGRSPSAVSALAKTGRKSSTTNSKKAAATTSKKAAATKPGSAIDTPPIAASKQMTIWLTGYSYQDNTPAGSATVSHPILHKVAGGTGTYADPITVAVPGKGSGIWKAGSRFYLPSVKRYVIVEDTGASPAPSGDAGHLDMWVDGQGGSKAESDKCMDQITTQTAKAIYSPPANLPVQAGSITKNGKCNIPT